MTRILFYIYKQIELEEDSWVHEHLEENRELLKTLLSINVSFMRYTKDENYIDNYEFVFEAVKQNGMNLQYASDRLRAEKAIQELALEDDKITDKKLVSNMFIVLEEHPIQDIGKQYKDNSKTKKAKGNSTTKRKVNPTNKEGHKTLKKMDKHSRIILPQVEDTIESA